METQELLDGFIIELERNKEGDKHRLTQLWADLFETMDPEHVKLIEADMWHIVEARANHKKPILTRLTGFVIDHLIMRAYFDELKWDLTLPGIIGNILIEYPKAMGFYTCRGCQYPIPRGGDKLPFCPVCGAIIEGTKDNKSAVPDISK